MKTLNFWPLTLLTLSLGITSCASPAKIAAPFPPTVPAVVSQMPPVPRQDIFHVIAPGETLWRIGKMYDVPINEITRANKIPPTHVLRKGEKLLVPQATAVRPVITLYPSNQWTHIIIHHSATDEGDSLLFDNIHRNKGWDSVGYHFIIDNGSKGKADGQIESSPRWIKQLPGAHCKAGGMNEKGIGICLVGNFNNQKPSQRQMDALTDLVQKLKTYYKIPARNIMGHKHAPGAATDCPGNDFPWDTFNDNIQKSSNP